MDNTTELTTTNSNQEIAKKLNSEVFNVLGKTALAGFEKAFVISEAITKLRGLLTEEYMKPVMALQGSRLGFRTDKDKTGGYPIAVVRDCLIDAVLMGLQPYGNQFNIISGNTYPTKEGTGFILNKYPGLKYDIIIGLPRISNDKTSAAVEATINWTINETSSSKVVPIPIKIDAYASVDSIIGKATRKARAWLISNLTGIEVTDGDVADVDAKVVSSKIAVDKVDKEAERIEQMIGDAKTLADLDMIRPHVMKGQEELFANKLEELNTKK